MSYSIVGSCLLSVGFLACVVCAEGISNAANYGAEGTNFCSLASSLASSLKYIPRGFGCRCNQATSINKPTNYWSQPVSRQPIPNEAYCLQPLNKGRIGFHEFSDAAQ